MRTASWVTRFATLAWMIAAVPSAAYAGHIGGYVGPSIFMDSGDNSTFFTGGVDAALELLPTFEIGGFYNHIAVTNAAITQIGAEANLYPLLLKNFYIGGKIGNSNQLGTNHIVYAPAGGFNFDLAPSLTFGVDGDYFIYSGGGMDLTLFASIKFWF